MDTIPVGRRAATVAAAVAVTFVAATVVLLFETPPAVSAPRAVAVGWTDAGASLGTLDAPDSELR